jgi:hypothetical protein
MLILMLMLILLLLAGTRRHRIAGFRVEVEVVIEGERVVGVVRHGEPLSGGRCGRHDCFQLGPSVRGCPRISTPYIRKREREREDMTGEKRSGGSLSRDPRQAAGAL